MNSERTATRAHVPLPADLRAQGLPFAKFRAVCKCDEAACILLMVPQELITYGGNGSVLSNWAQFLLLAKYLCEMTTDQTLSMYSGHPWASTRRRATPRMVATNGMVVPNYSSKADYARMYAQGVSIYGQMTAGSYCYIGPQGIVHGTTITVLNAGSTSASTTSRARAYVSSGLGGMSGAQPKAAVITGAVGVIAEVDEAALRKRHAQGWVDGLRRRRRRGVAARAARAARRPLTASATLAPGATWPRSTTGGGCGWGEVTNGGFGHVPTADDAGAKAARMLHWDVTGGALRAAPGPTLGHGR
ncbi:urocanate hydratase [Aureococcus anophagefferens]|nr:urocanate hydratase [Aureococcus anophagefferens]